MWCRLEWRTNTALITEAPMSTSRLSAVQWHNARRRKIFQNHPEARALVGRNPWSAALVLFMVALQLSLAVWLSDLPWFLVVMAAFIVGAVTAHSLSTFIHEASHDLIFRTPLANRIIAIIANVPLVFPAAIDFRDKHLLHHKHLGEPDGADTQAPLDWDFAFATTPIRTFIWHCIGPMMPRGVVTRNSHATWLWVNWLVHAAVLVPFTMLFGFNALLFLGASGFFAFGPHPVAARRYGEHLTLGKDQPTTSYYGPYNWVSFNIGHHVEHHDVPSIPWNRLPKLKALAHEQYAPLAFVTSWRELIWQLFTVKGEGPKRYFLERPHHCESESHDDSSCPVR